MANVDLGQVETVRLHGHDRAFLRVGSGPALLLIHGIGSRHETWDRVIPELAKRYTVIAPDLLGHGRSAKPRADYSIGGYANGLRDLLCVLGIDRATIVGHSLGGGIAMQFAYQFPKRTERLVLVGTGGLGPEVNKIIPLCTLPGASTTLGLLTRPSAQRIGVPLLKALHRTGLRRAADLEQLSLVYSDLRTREARDAFRHVLRAIVDMKGQIVTMRDRAYLTEFIPTMVVWGERDTVIPVEHAEIAERELSHAVIKIFEGAGHFPHAEFPELFSDVLIEFIETTAAARYNPAKWDRSIRRGRIKMYETLPDQDEIIGVDLTAATS